MRYVKLLPFAIILAPLITAFCTAVCVSYVLSCLYRGEESAIIRATSLVTLLITLIVLQGKIAHFYTLVIGFHLFTIALVLLFRGLFLKTKHPYRTLIAASIAAALNPAIHLLLLFGISLAFLCVGSVLFQIHQAHRSRRLEKTSHTQGTSQSSSDVCLWKRLLGAIIIVSVFTILPYALFAKFFVFSGQANISEIIPDSYLYIKSGSLSLLHRLSFDGTSAVDNYLTGSYTPKSPRIGKIFYFLLAILPLTTLRKPVLSREQRRLILFSGALFLFSIWGSLGYQDASFLFPTLHSLLAWLSQGLFALHSPLPEYAGNALSNAIHVLRNPDRFQFITLASATILLPIGLRMFEKGMQSTLNAMQRPRRSFLLAALCTVLLFLPLFSCWEYRMSFSSGDFAGALSPYPVGPLGEVKQALDHLPPGKIIVLPPSETPRLVRDINGNDHKFIDKFYIYYLDKPSYYYGMSGEIDNKRAFFLLFQALNNNQNWWLNVLRSLKVQYLVLNKELVPTSPYAPQYLSNIEAALANQPTNMQGLVRKVMENQSFALYEILEDPQATEGRFIANMDWQAFMCFQERNLGLTKNGQMLPLSSPEDTYRQPITILSQDEEKTLLDVYAKTHTGSFVTPDQTYFAFSPDHVPSSYYSERVVTMTNLLEGSKYNLIGIVMPGIFDTLSSTFVGLPKSDVTLRFSVNVPEEGNYQILLRGIATKNHLSIEQDNTTIDRTIDERDSHVQYYEAGVPMIDAKRVEVTEFSAEEVENMIPGEIVPVSNRFDYIRLGMLPLREGVNWIFMTKHDNNPLVVEGILALNEEESSRLSQYPSNIHIRQTR
jgi:hypothetical protein